MRALVAVIAAGFSLGVVAARPQIRVDVDLVLANVTVTDNRDRFVAGLQKEHFRVFEDKVEQEILTFGNEDAPVTLGVIFDRSGSMGGRPPQNAGVQYDRLIDQIRSSAYRCLQGGQRDDEYFLIEFSDKPQVVSDFTNDLSQLKEQIFFAGAGGRTALWDAVYAGVEKAQQGRHARKALLVLTDGLENNSRYTLKNVKDVLRENDVRIYTTSREQVMFDGLADMVEMTGGRIFRTDSPCNELAAELRNQYIIGYRSTNRERNGEFRKISVRINSDTLPKGVSALSVRARAGYYAVP